MMSHIIRMDDLSPPIDVKLLQTKNSKTQAWLSVHGLIWDVTEVLAWHPGGEKIILDNCGREDSTQVFEKYHNSSMLEATLGKRHIIGRIANSVIKSEEERNNKVETLWISIKDAEEEARTKTSEVNFAYFATGAEDEVTLQANEAIFRRYCWFKPAMLRDVSCIDLQCKILGKTLAAPLMISASAIQGLANPEQGELCAFRAARRANIAHMAAHLSSRPWLDYLSHEVPKEPESPRYLQIYLPRLESELNTIIVNAEALGFEALFITVDSSAVGKRERDLRTRNRFSSGATHGTAPRSTATNRWDDGFTWNDLAKLKSKTRLPIILKGVQRADDALRAYRAGVAGIMVSNHGGRNLDGARPSLASLVEINKALKAAGVRKNIIVFFDGGVRRGGDILKGICCGADVVGIGRPILYGVAARGENGASQIIDILVNELITTMKLVGCASLKEADDSLVEYGVSYL